MKNSIKLNLKAVALVMFTRLLLGLPCYAQDTTLFHFPLNTGDMWEYERKAGFLATTTVRKVVGDTIFANQERYQQIDEANPQFGMRTNFLRKQDSTRIFTLLPNTSVPIDTLLFHLELYNGKEWRSGLYNEITALMRVDSVYRTTLFGQTRSAARIVLPEITFGIFEYIFVDSLGIYFIGFEGGTETLAGAVIEGTRYGIFTSVREIEERAAFAFVLFQTYPNPFNPSTHIRYSLPHTGEVAMRIFNLLGEEVRGWQNVTKPAGEHSLLWDGKDAHGVEVSSGVYLLQISYRSFENGALQVVQSRKLTLVR